MLKILLICNKAPFPPNDGSSIATANMAKGLIQNDAVVHTLAINTKKHFKPDSGISAELKQKTNYTSVFKNTNTSIAGALWNLFSNESYFVSRFYFKKFEKVLAEKLQDNVFDIIQIEGLFMAVYISTIRKYSKARIILRTHNVEHLIWKRHIPNERSALKKMYLSLQNKRLRNFELKVICEVDAVIPITEADAFEFKRSGCSKPVYACITGVDVVQYQQKLSLTEKAATVFYFGSMDWLPNQEAVTWFLNNCWSKIHKAVPEARFIIAGRGMPLEFFHINKPNVIIVEEVENGKAFFQQHQVMVVPLLSGSGLRIKIIEGMAYGKAIVSTTIGAEGISCTNNMNILIADEAGTFSECVITLLKDHSKRKELELNAGTLALREFNNTEVVAGLVSFYKTILNG